MAAAVFYQDDLCVMREDPTILGIVYSTSSDIDVEPLDVPLDWLAYPEDPQHVMVTDSIRKSGIPPKGYVIIRFVEPHGGSCLVSEEDLELVDRTIAIGEVVKKRTSDAISGVVARTSKQCNLLPAYPRLELWNQSVWPPREENILRNIPGEELRFLEEFDEGDYVIYRGWVGVVNAVYEDVTIRLDNNSVVTVEDSDELRVLAANSEQMDHALKLMNATKGTAWLVHSLSLLAENGKDSQAVKSFYLGQRVVTKKANLRRGKWHFGVYNPNVSPTGTVVEVRESSVRVTWLSSNVYDRDRDNSEPPPKYLGLDELGSGEVRAYSDGRLSSQINASVGAFQGSELMSGDHVKFEDIAGAAVKYSEGSVHGTMRKIPRLETQGYDMNVFLVRETILKLLIHWQDGTTSEEEAKNIVPHINSDEHELWPGKIVAIKTNEDTITQASIPSSSTKLLKPSRIGIVQSADARERTANVRWFVEPNIQIFDDSDPAILPGSTLGLLSQEDSEVSCFEIVSYSALDRHIGDIVLITPTDNLDVQDDRPSGGVMDYISSALYSLRNHFPPSIASADNESLTTPPARDSNDCFGTIVDLGLDGVLTVRLGALDNIRDIKVPLERVTTLAGAEGADSYDISITEEEMVDEDDWTGSDSYENSEQRVIEESVEYEGGRRLSADGGDDMWMTEDDDCERPVSPPEVNESEEASAPTDEAPSSIADNDLVSGRPQFSQLSAMPSKFAILNEAPPPSLPFMSNPVSLNANLMRRIRKEHKILQSSLPERIWARAWADRLDLIRVLIIGAEGTPYNLAPFVVDFQFPQDFPRVPPEAYFHSWTNGLGRINPNLYEDGKICLSLLGTWSGEGKHESWSETGSSMLQVIVSLLGLVLVKDPYYNEAGYEALAGSEDYKLSAQQYAERVEVMSKGFIVHALSHDIAGLSDILAWLYNRSEGGSPQLLHSVISECIKTLQYSERARKREELEAQKAKDADTIEVDEKAKAEPSRLSSGAMVMLRKQITAMEGCLEKCGYRVMGEEH